MDNPAGKKKNTIITHIVCKGEESHVPEIHYSSYLHKKCVVKHAGSSNLTYVETHQVSLKYVTDSRCYLREINKMQAGNYTKMKDYAVLNYLLYRLSNPSIPSSYHSSCNYNS